MRSPGLAVYGWVHIIEVATGYDICKQDAFLSTEAYQVFTHLTYMKDKNDLDALLIKQNQK